MPLVTIDDIPVEVPEGTTILEAARMIGGDIVPPAMCFHSKLKTSGGYCRTCIVKVEQGSAKDPRPMPKPVASCRTTVMDGMVVKNKTSERVQEGRGGVVEFLLINHPLDCPVCDQAGECDLQNLSFEHGKLQQRFVEEKRTFEPEDIGDKIQLHMNRCIVCQRCVEVADQLTDGRVHGVLNLVPPRLFRRFVFGSASLAFEPHCRNEHREGKIGVKAKCFSKYLNQHLCCLGDTSISGTY